MPSNTRPGGSPRRRRLVAAVRDRMRTRAVVRDAEAPAPPPPRPRPAAPPPHDVELERLEAEARYHGDRFDLYRARVISGSRIPTTPARLRELKQAATAAAERLAHARRLRKAGPPEPPTGGRAEDE